MATAMATSMNERTFQIHSKALDDLEEEFTEKLHKLTTKVKETMFSAESVKGLQCLQRAMVFLTQTFPEMTDSYTDVDETSDQISKLSLKLSELEKANAQLEKANAQLEKANALLSKKVANNATSQKELKSKVEELNKKVHMQEKHIMGFRRLQKLLEPKTEPSQGATAAVQSGTLKSLSQRFTFSCKLGTDEYEPWILDVVVLPGELILLADNDNRCVKLFNSKGKHLQSCSIGLGPSVLAVLDNTLQNNWKVAVTHSWHTGISLLQVSLAGITVQSRVPTRNVCYAIALVDSQTLAVSYLDVFAIDIIDRSGKVLRQISTSYTPLWMGVTPDQHLVVTTKDGRVVKLRLADGSVIFNIKKKELKYPRGITCQQDGSYIVADVETRTLHLLDQKGTTSTHLWSHPHGADGNYKLWGVHHLNNVVVCCSSEGEVFILDGC